jgi:hypothetical protein
MSRVTSVNVPFTGDASSLIKAAKESQKAMRETARENARLAKQMKSDTRELISTITGQFGEIGGMIGDLIKSASALGVVIGAVTAIAKAWQRSKENIDLYLKSADKLALGSAGYALEAEKARVETRRRANGMIAEGYRIEQENTWKLEKVSSLLTDEQKKFLALQIKEAQIMQENGRRMRDAVTGIKDKTQWGMQYNKLLQEQETLNDEGLVRMAEWEKIEAQLMMYKTIIADKDKSSEEKTKAIAEAEKLAAQLLKDKTTFTQKQIKNLEELSRMTVTEEAVEEQIAGWKKDIATYEKEYGKDMLMNLRLENKTATLINKEAGDAERKLRAVKELNTTLTTGYRLGQLTKDIAPTSTGTSWKTSGRDMTKLTTVSPAKIPTIAEMSQTLGISEQLNDTIVNIASSFAGMFITVGGGFKMITDSIKRMIAMIAARAGILGLLQLLIPFLPGKFGLGGLTLFSAKNIFGGIIPGFAAGTNYAPGGLAMVGERGPELVNLPRGSRVTPIGNERLIARISGRDLNIILQRYNSELSANT